MPHAHSACGDQERILSSLEFQTVVSHHLVPWDELCPLQEQLVLLPSESSLQTTEIFLDICHSTGTKYRSSLTLNTNTNFFSRELKSYGRSIVNIVNENPYLNL